MQKHHPSENTPNSQSNPTLQDDNDGKRPTNTETGGVKGLEPTRYGDWEKNGRCIDF